MKAANLSREAYDGIIRMIFEGRLQPGDALHEARLGEALSMSRTPVREAIKRMQGEGLAEQAGRFTRVRMQPCQEIWEVFFIRLQLEPPAARAAVRLQPHRIEEMIRRVRALMGTDARAGRAEHWRVDDDLHAMIAGAADNRTAEQLIAEMRRRTCMFDSEQVPERFAKGCEEHLEILAALRDGSPDRAERAMVRHVEGARDAILHRLEALDRGLGGP